MRVLQLTMWDSGAARTQATLVRRVIDDITRGRDVFLYSAVPMMYGDAHWTGTTAMAAEQVMKDRLATGQNVAHTLEQMAGALVAFAAEVDAAQSLMRAALSNALPDVSVSDDGSCTPVPQPAPAPDAWSSLPNPFGPPPVDNWAVLAKCQSIHLRINEAFALATTADTRCASVLREAESVLDAILGRTAPTALATLDRQSMTPLQWLKYLADVPPAGTDPAAVAEWWACHDAPSQRQLIEHVPEGIGNLDGIPAAARNAANRRRMDAELIDIPAKIAALARWMERHPDDYEAQKRLDDLAERLDYVNAVREQVSRAEKWMDGHRVRDGLTGDWQPPDVVHLLIFDPDAFHGRGRAALSYGSTDTADNVALMVPGLRQWVPNGFKAVVGNSERTFDAARTLDPDHSVAVVAYVAYDAPGFLEVSLGGRARHGASRLDATVDGLRAVRAGGPPMHLVAVLHSYGSTTGGIAVERLQAQVDDVVFVGSPGVGVDRAKDLGLPPGHVWVGAASKDETSFLQRFGVDPASADFGANRFQAEFKHAPWDYRPIKEHSQYFNDNSESVANIAHIISGDYASVVRADPRRSAPPALRLIPPFNAPVEFDPEAFRKTIRHPKTTGTP